MSSDVLSLEEFIRQSVGLTDEQRTQLRAVRLVGERSFDRWVQVLRDITGAEVAVYRGGVGGDDLSEVWQQGEDGSVVIIAERSPHPTPLRTGVGLSARYWPETKELWLYNELVGHQHAWDEIQGKPETFAVSWPQILAKPETFPPTAHNHRLGDIIGLETALGKKADLDAQGKFLVSQAPDALKTQSFVVGSEEAMLTLPAQTGDFAIRADRNNAVYLLTGDRSNPANWINIRSEAGTPVTSVNGATGDVVLTASSVKAAPDGHLSDYANPHRVTKEQVGLGRVSNVEQLPLAQKGAQGGVAPLDAQGYIPLHHLPAGALGQEARLGSVESDTADLPPDAERVVVLTVPSLDLTVRQVRALGLQQVQGDQLRVRFFESGDPDDAATWSARSYEALFGFHGGQYFTIDDMPFPFFDQGGLKRVRVWMKNAGSTTISAAGVALQFLYRG